MYPFSFTENVPGLLENSIQEKSQLKCNTGSFILKGMKSRHPWLGCLEIGKELRVTERYLGSGAEKIVSFRIYKLYFVVFDIIIIS